MAIRSTTLHELRAACAGASDALVPELPARHVVVVDLDEAEHDGPPPGLPDDLPVVVAGLSRRSLHELGSAAAACDLVLPPDSPLLEDVVRAVVDRPIAAASLVTLLRGSVQRSVPDGLLAESAVYSALQAGPEHDAWLRSRPRRRRGAEGDPVVVARDHDRLMITLARPHVHNAFDVAMRDALTDALALAALDDSITAVHLDGEGESFCAGGDLDEFGRRPDPATAHLVRLYRSPARALEAVSERVTVHLHGACIGAGIEVPAFARTVLAAATLQAGLPEIALGLIPGAGGTISLPRRIGRHRTALLCLADLRLDAPTARAWGLVDGLEGEPAGG